MAGEAGRREHTVVNQTLKELSSTIGISRGAILVVRANASCEVDDTSVICTIVSKCGARETYRTGPGRTPVEL